MACGVFGTKPLTESVLIDRQVNYNDGIRFRHRMEVKNVNQGIQNDVVITSVNFRV